MSRSYTSKRWKSRRLLGAHKRSRNAVHQVLRSRAGVRPDDFHEVLADQLEERGANAQAQVLRQGEELLLPVVPHGASTRLRW
jgi:hypothetical protein